MYSAITGATWTLSVLILDPSVMIVTRVPG